MSNSSAFINIPPLSGSGGSGVGSLNGLTGAVTLAPGSNITITPSGNTLTIASTGGSSLTFADSLVNTAGTVTLVNDTASVGASQYYGSNSSSILGYYSLPTGNVVGPASSTTNAVATYSNTTGELLLNTDLIYTSDTLNNADVTSGTGTAGTLLTIRGANQTVASGTAAGAALTIKSGSATGTSSTGASGTLIVTSGTSVGGNTGAVEILSANVTGTNVVAGQIVVTAGHSNKSSSGASVTITAGSNTGTGNGGQAGLTGGFASGGGNGGSTIIQGGGVSGGGTPGVIVMETKSGTDVAMEIGIANGNDVQLGGSANTNLLWNSDGHGSVGLNTGNRPAGVYALTTMNLNSLTASEAIFSDASKNFVSNAVSGTGSVAMTNNAALSGPSIASATWSGTTATGQTASSVLQTDSSGNLTVGTVTVPQGGTDLTSLTAYAVLTGGTTSTGPMQQVSGLGTSGYVLTSNGAAALPTWQAAGGGGGVSGPGTATTNAIATYANTGGTAILNTGISITPSTNQVFPGTNGTTLMGGDGISVNYWGPGYFKQLYTNPGAINGNGLATILSATGAFGSPRAAITGILANTTAAGAFQNGVGLMIGGLDPGYTTREDYVVFRLQTSPFLAGTISSPGYLDSVNGAAIPLIITGGNNDNSGIASPGQALYLTGGLTLASGQNGANVVLAGGAGGSGGKQGVINHNSGVSDTYQYSQPTTGGTVTVLATVPTVIIDPAGTLTSLTITLPGSTAADGQKIQFGISQIITTLTVNSSGSATVVGTPNTTAVGSSATYIYKTSTLTWYKIG